MSGQIVSWSVADQLLTKRLVALKEQLESVHPANLERLQGEIAGIRFALDIPNEITRDAERKATAPSRDTPVY